METSIYSGKELEETLVSGSFESKENLILTGMVKSSETKGFISFSQNGCDNWIEVPIEMIESAEKGGNQSCKDHSHTIMHITFKEVSNPETKLFTNLLVQSIVKRKKLHENDLKNYSTNKLNYINSQSEFPSNYRTNDLFSMKSPNKIRAMLPNFPGLVGGGGLNLIECDISCGICKDCFPFVGCIPYPCCELSDCTIKI